MQYFSLTADFSEDVGGAAKVRAAAAAASKGGGNAGTPDCSSAALGSQQTALIPHGWHTAQCWCCVINAEQQECVARTHIKVQHAITGTADQQLNSGAEASAG
jgi:hypothetical protein